MDEVIRREIRHPLDNQTPIVQRTASHLTDSATLYQLLSLSSAASEVGITGYEVYDKRTAVRFLSEAKRPNWL
jgi:hypothetical protein